MAAKHCHLSLPQQRAQVTGILLVLQEAAARIFVQQKPLPWVIAYISQGAIEQVLEGTTAVLHELGFATASLIQIPPEELAAFWLERLYGLLNVSWREAPKFERLQYDTIRALASSAYAMVKQGARYERFLRCGPPPGVAELPVLASDQKAKTLPLPFTLRGNPATQEDNRFEQYVSHMRTLRRRPGARSLGCVLPSDTARPALYV